MQVAVYARDYASTYTSTFFVFYIGPQSLIAQQWLVFRHFSFKRIQGFYSP